MTRLLVPEMFGLMAIAITIWVGLTLFSDVGLRQNVIQSHRGEEVEFLNTAWIMQILQGFLIWLMALVGALGFTLSNKISFAPSASVYSDPSLPYVISVLSFGAVIQGFGSTKLFQASRSLSLKRITGIEISAQLGGLISMLAWVTVDRSVWAMVAGTLSSTAIRSVLSHVWLPGLSNRFSWNAEAFRQILAFGKWIFLSSMLGFLVNHGDRLLLGGFLDARTLGVYSIAFLFFAAVDQVLGKIMGDVAFPALSEVARNRPVDLKRSYYRIHTTIGLIAFFSAGFLMAAGSALIHALYDARYHEAGWMLTVLSIALLTLPYRVVVHCFMALGMPKLQSLIIVVRLITLFVCTPLGFYLFGLPGALWGIVVSHFSSLPMLIVSSARHGLWDWRREMALLPGILVGLVMGYGFSFMVSRF